MSTTAPEATATEAPPPATQPAEPAPAAPQQAPAPAPPAQPPAPQQQPAAPAQQAPAPQPPAQPPAPAPRPPAAAVPQPPQQPARPPASLREMPPRPPDGAPEAERLQWEVMYWRTAARQHEGRVKAKNEQLSTQEAFLRRVAEVVGVEYDQQPDPEELSAKLEAANTAAKAGKVELAVYMTAAQSGANAPALLDSREFMSRTAGLDADSQDFQAHVAELVREAAQQERYQVPKPPPPAPPVADPAGQQVPPPAPAQPPAAANGADFSGAPGGNRLWTQADYDHYMATANTEDRDGKKLSKAIEDGLLANLGVGRPKHRSYR